MPMGCAGLSIISRGALQLLDIIVGAAIEVAPLSSPPASPALGACYLIGPSPTGAWAGRQNQLAGYTGGGWRFVVPQEGMAALVKSSGLTVTFRAGAWDIGTVVGAKFSVDGQQIVGARAAAIAAPTGGATVDTQARSAIGLILAALRQHGLIEP